jgi:hypothetical protein
MAELKTELDALGAGQQKNADHIEAQLADMSDAQKAALYSKKAGAGVWDATGGGLWDMVKTAGSFYVGYLKTMCKIAQTPDKMARATAAAIMTGSTSPFKNEIDKIVTPVAQTYEQAKHYRSMLTILLGEPLVYEQLYDFAQRYYKATHPAELTKMGASAAADIIVTILLAIFTVGTGAAANIAAKSTRLTRIFKLLEKITAGIRRIDPRSRLLSTSKGSAGKAGKAAKSPVRSSARGVPEVKSLRKDARPPDKLDNRTDKRDDGPKTTPGDPKKPNKAKNKSTTEPSRTKPSGKKGGKPRGERAPESGSQKRKHQRENESADTLADAGYDVDQGPHTKPNGKNPDYKIEGEYFDCLAPDTDNIDQVRKGISRKVKSGQTERIILNMDDTNLKPSDITDVLQRKPKQGLKEVIGIKKGKITQIFP